jgi:hypothetical protein
METDKFINQDEKEFLLSRNINDETAVRVGGNGYVELKELLRIYAEQYHQAKLKESASQQEQGYTRDDLRKMLMEFCNKNFTKTWLESRLPSSMVEEYIKTIPPSQQTTKTE